MRYFNAKVTDGKIPLVLIPKYPTLFNLFMQVPSGMYVLNGFDLLCVLSSMLTRTLSCIAKGGCSSSAGTRTRA